MSDHALRRPPVGPAAPAHGDLTEADLVSAAREGDDTAFELLLRRYDYLVRMRARTFFLQGAEYEDLDRRFAR